MVFFAVVILVALVKVFYQPEAVIADRDDCFYWYHTFPESSLYPLYKTLYEVPPRDDSPAPPFSKEQLADPQFMRSMRWGMHEDTDLICGRRETYANMFKKFITHRCDTVFKNLSPPECADLVKWLGRACRCPYDTHDDKEWVQCVKNCPGTEDIFMFIK